MMKMGREVSYPLGLEAEFLTAVGEGLSEQREPLTLHGLQNMIG